jgi:hypothetical protein
MQYDPRVAQPTASRHLGRDSSDDEADHVRSPVVIIALMIGELKYQPTLNTISTAITKAAVDLWQRHPGTLLICESEPMRQAALKLDVPQSSVRVALEQANGHTTRRLAEWLRASKPTLPAGNWWAITHSIHANRASRILARCHVTAKIFHVDSAFDRADLDWKLRSAGRFKAYNHLAGIYCSLRRWQ